MLFVLSCYVFVIQYYRYSVEFYVIYKHFIHSHIPCGTCKQFAHFPSPMECQVDYRLELITNVDHEWIIQSYIPPIIQTVSIIRVYTIHEIQGRVIGVCDLSRGVHAPLTRWAVAGDYEQHMPTTMAECDRWHNPTYASCGHEMLTSRTWQTLARNWY